MIEQKRRYFGTDGIRGRVGDGAITPDFVLKLGWAVGRVLAKERNSKVLIGKDTRISGYMFESALQAGLSAAGVDVYLMGPMPTPAVAYLTRTFHAQAGIVISASHNPYHDNGIKFFSDQGTKLPDSVELAIEAMLDQPIKTVDSAHLGKAHRIADAAGRYIEFCKSTISTGVDLSNLKIVVDCAHGATYHIAPNVFRELGAEVILMGADPDGLNINQNCGSTEPRLLQASVLEHKADLGIALDGDGDRLIMVDHQGELVDGDDILFIIARGRQRMGLGRGHVVGTQMSNLGLQHALEKHDITLHRANVGDRYVMEKLQQVDGLIGGEASGHIICLDKTSTGDGIVAALQVLAEIQQTGSSLHELRSAVIKYPQRLINVRINKLVNLQDYPEIQTAVESVEAELGNEGRVLLRASGTEPVIRVMVEGHDATRTNQLSKSLAEQIETILQG
ncbi:MAG: phosphoglucosamine mutase [Methylophaga sp.]|uniref:phosphoglucosamine mutase n=1 Tax=unclassified Methylophaga TaxID=2629249 RepID=UPI000C8DA571|nr:phosphoglucosamine mutase [Methylophaga sp.]MAY17149.1 phosphoglucosamine mutase [Methylophaga sp.]MBN46058.1 phosphoglucosamine mutase [Methylophaga sp.]HAO23629.1 phosphoglucosamine mutase [Methylophaga sp.]